MSNETLKLIGVGLVCLVVGYGFASVQPQTLGGTTRSSIATTGNLAASGTLDVQGNTDLRGTLTVTGATALNGGITLTGETTLGNCATASWNPGSLASSSADGINETSTDIAVTGAALGDSCIASLDSATSTSAFFGCNISGTATGTITLLNTGTAALDLATGTAKICYLD